MDDNVPPKLGPYLEANTPLPNELNPVYAEYSAQISSRIHDLRSAAVDPGRTAAHEAIERDRQVLEGRREACLEFFSPIRSVPVEVLGLIFSFILGGRVFNDQEYRTYGRLGAVCIPWRNALASTPRLCAGLVVSLEKCFGRKPPTKDDDVMTIFKRTYVPSKWLALVNPARYHLTIDVRDERALEGVAWEDIPSYLLLNAEVLPTSLSVTYLPAISKIFLQERSCISVAHLSIDPVGEQPGNIDMSQMQRAFPRLESFTTGWPPDSRLLQPFPHDHIRSLTFLEAKGAALDLARFCAGLSRLQELKLTSENSPSGEYGLMDTLHPVVLPALESLYVVGEELTHLLAHFVFPALKFFRLEAIGYDDAAFYMVKELRSFLQRSNPTNFTMSVRGHASKHAFAVLLAALPPETKLHLSCEVKELGRNDAGAISQSPPSFDFANVRAIVSPELQWLSEDMDIAPLRHAITVYTSGKHLTLNDPQASYARQNGFDVEECTPDVAKSIRRPGISYMPTEWWRSRGRT